MSKYIKVKDAIEVAINGCASWDGGYFPSMDDPIKGEFASIEDKCIEIVRCGECKHWEAFKNGVNGWCNRHGVPQGSFWFCADGERKDGGTEHGNTYSLGKIEMPKDAIEQIIKDGERKDGEHEDRIDRC